MTRVLEILDQAKVKVDVALWAFLSEYEDWRLVVAGRQFDSPDARDGYRLLNDSLDAAGFALRKTPPILILPTNDRFIRDLRRKFGKTKIIEGMRLRDQMFGDRFVEDAYIDRIS